MTNEQLKTRIMQRVHAIYFFNRALSPVLLKVYVLCIAFLSTLSFVSISHVVANLESVSSFSGLYAFTSTAVTHTELSVQLALLLAALFIVWIVRDLTFPVFFAKRATV